MADISLVDVSIRDGNQSLWSATGLNTAQMLQIAGPLDRVGFRAIDFTSSTHMAVAVRYARNDPWERIRRMRAAMPRTPLQFITTGLRFIAWQQADPDFMRSSIAGCRRTASAASSCSIPCTMQMPCWRRRRSSSRRAMPR